MIGGHTEGNPQIIAWKENWKEKYLKFVIEYHFNEDFLEKINQAHDL